MGILGEELMFLLRKYVWELNVCFVFCFIEILRVELISEWFVLVLFVYVVDDDLYFRVMCYLLFLISFVFVIEIKWILYF